MWQRLKKYSVRFLAFLGFMTLFPILGIMVVVLSNTHAPLHKLPERGVLTLIMEELSITDHPITSVSGYFNHHRISLNELIQTIKIAAKDKRVTALSVKLDGMDLELSSVYELRQAIAQFKESGKKTYIYADSMGEDGPSLGHYYFASVFHEIYMQPTGFLSLTGIQADIPFAGKLLEELGIKPRIGAREEFKDAYAPFTEATMPTPMAESTKSLISHMYAELLSGISKDREIDKENLEHLMSTSPILSDQKALKEGLVDGLIYYDQYLKSHEKLGKEIDVIEYAQVSLKNLHENHEQDTIAVIYASGMLSQGQDDGFLSDPFILGAEEMREAFEDVRKDPHVKAVVLRINSPGGSPSVSESVWREVVRTQEKKIPVIASIGSVGASGGYWIAAPCDKIAATPLTITGSIGVLMGKVVFKGLLEKLNVNVSSVDVGPNGGFWSPLQDYTDTQWQQIQRTLDDTYQQFIQKVVSGRDLPQEHVRQVAKGRAWTGVEAKEFGLVDALGGLEDAILIAKKEVKIPDTQKVNVIVYPKEKPIFAKISAVFTGSKVASRTWKMTKTYKPFFMDMKAATVQGPQVYAVVPRL